MFAQPSYINDGRARSALCIANEFRLRLRGDAGRSAGEADGVEVGGGGGRVVSLAISLV